MPTQVRTRTVSSWMSVTKVPIPDNTIITYEELKWITSDKDIHFTGAIPQNAVEEENITDLTDNRLLITDVVFQCMENINFRVLFFSKDVFSDGDLDTDSYLGYVDVPITTAGVRIGGAGQYYVNITGVAIAYQDEDDTKELHIALQCTSVAGKTAGAVGAVRLKIGYKVGIG